MAALAPLTKTRPNKRDFQRTLVVLAISFAIGRIGWPGETEPRYQTDPKHMVDGEYRGRFTPDAEYVLSGQFRKDLGPLPQVPFRYVTDDEGYDPKALTPVPPPGVHPRVLMSPSDVERIRAEVAKDDGAHPWFRTIWNDIKSAKPLAHLHGLTSVALVALVTEDQKLGREAAEKLLEYAAYMEPAIDLFNGLPELAGTRDNWYYYARTAVLKVGGVLYRDAFEAGGTERIRELARKGVELGGGGKSSGDLFNTVLRGYDYVHPFMTDAERARVRRVIAKATAGRYTTGMELPGNWFINNHMSMGEDLLITHLAIEGEEGYDPRLLREYSKAVHDKLTYDISVAGHLHEKCKGYIPERAVLAISRRAGQPETGALPLLRHDHLRAIVWAKVMDSTNVPYGVPDIGKREEAPRRWWMGYGSGPWMDQFFNWAFLLKHVYPRDPVVDYFYKERLTQHGFGPARPEPDAKLPKPRIRYTWRDVMLLCVTDGLRDAKGQVIDYDQDGLPKEVLARQEAYVDLPRGVAMSRSSWDEDALHIHYECRSDTFMTGHETPEAGDFNLVSHGVQWSLRRDWYMDCYFRNMVLIDGRAGVYPPPCGKLMQVEDSAASTTFVSDATIQYNWWQGGKNFYDWHGAFDDAKLHMAPWRGSDRLSRGSELPFPPHMRRYHEGLAGLDWGAWHGESRGPGMYRRWNHVDHVFRTLHMTKGETPYVLIVDDVRKDDQVHQYDWCLHLERDIAFYTADSAVRNRFLSNLGQREDNVHHTDLLLCLKDVPEKRYDRYGIKVHRDPKKGDPLLLVRVLWRNTDYPFPQPAFEEGKGASLAACVRVPALAVDPEFRVLLFPHRFGDKLPITSWNADRTKLTVLVGGHRDVYTFARTDRERTVFVMARDGKLAARPGAGSAGPKLDSPHGWTPDRNHPDAPRTFLITGEDMIAFQPLPLGQVIRYTLDGSEPTEASTLYVSPFTVPKSCTLKARTFARYWPFADDNGSETLEVRVTRVGLAHPILAPRADRDPALAGLRLLGFQPGLACEVFERHHTIFDEKTGIFTGRKNMLPRLDMPLLVCRVSGFGAPPVGSRLLSAAEMAKGYYQYNGFLKVEADGVHGFRVNSCGPVVLKIGGQEILAVTGPYGLSQKNRYGQAALQAGLHSLELVVCDPVFWKDGRDGPYSLQVGHLAPGEAVYRPIPPSAMFTYQTKRPPLPEPTVPVGKAVRSGPTTTGLVMNCYDRLGLHNDIPADGLPSAHFEIGADEKPYLTRSVLGLEGSDVPGRLVEYRGFLVADVRGVYAFALDRTGANQLRIDGQLVEQSRVDAPSAPGAIRLEVGHHTFTLRLAKSAPMLLIKAPGRDTFEPAGIGLFARPSKATPWNDGRLLLHLDGEAMGADGALKNLAGAATARLRKGKLVEGRIGQGIKLTGADSRLEVEGLRTPEDAFSVGFWIRVDKRTDRNLLDCSWGSHPGGRLRGYTIWAFYFRGGPNAAFDLRKVGAHKGEWCHVAITYGPAVRLYVNGELRDWSVKDVAARRAYVTNAFLFSGLDATVDDVRLYNRVLSAEDVGKLAK